MFIAFLAAAASVQSSSPAPRFADVEIGTAYVRVPFPSGYCKPIGEVAAAAQWLAAADNRNITLLTLVRCGADTRLSDYLIVKTPITTLNTDVDRPALIEMVSKEMEGAEFKAKMGELQDAASDSLSKAAGTTVKIDSTIGPRGHDDTCVYVAGAGTMNAYGKSVPKVMGMCITAVASRGITLNAYKATTDDQAFLSLLPFLRQWALQLKAAPRK